MVYPRWLFGLHKKESFYILACVVAICNVVLSPHLDWEQADEIVFPIVTSCNDNPLLHAVILDCADSCSHIEICWGIKGNVFIQRSVLISF